MQKNNLYTYLSSCTAIVIALFMIQSCKKVEQETIKRPYDGIQRFAVPGYGSLDSINAVISGNDIVVYWNADAAVPEKIRPLIIVSTGATILPASGVEVNFSDTTTYTVTAEDGSIRKYKLKPVSNVAIPVLFSMPASYRWAQYAPLIIKGEYFFASGDASQIKVYAQRIKDGFEFDLEVDPAQTTSTQIIARLPMMTTDLDTGAHRIYVKVGGFASNSMEVNLARPSFYWDPLNITSVEIAPPGKPLKVGDSLTLVTNIKGITPEVFEKFYPKSTISDLTLIVKNNTGGYEAVTASSSDFAVSGNLIKIRVGDMFRDYIGYTVIYANITRRGVEGESGFGIEFPMVGAENIQIHNAEGSIPGNDNETEGTVGLELAQAGQNIAFGQELRLNYSFSSNAIRAKYAGRSSVEVYFRNTRTNSTGGRYITFTMNITDHGDYATFSVPTYFQSTLRDYAIYGIQAVFNSEDEPARYLNGSVSMPDLKTLLVTN
jgi:hypothetical protein